MTVQTMRLPDIGEGVAEAELNEWHVAVGDIVKEDDILAAVMTDKAVVEIPSPVSGKVLWLGGKVGDVLPVGCELVRLGLDGEGDVEAASPPAEDSDPVADTSDPPAASPPPVAPVENVSVVDGSRPLALPSVRQRARDAGIDLATVPSSGPGGRITHDDLDEFLTGGTTPARARKTRVEEIPVIGLRRKIAEQMVQSKTHIPHITIVEEVDVDNLEDLRRRLNADAPGAKLTVLPFIIRALTIAAGKVPQVNAHYDDEAGILRQFGPVHCGIATQTPRGLVVPVIRHAETLGLRRCAEELVGLAQMTRDGTAPREVLSGSTITISSLGPLGAIATTPIINRPETTIIGVNKIEIRPHCDGTGFVPRKKMNLSCSFDHRVIDGWDAAVFVQEVKSLLETPAMMFVEEN